MEFPPVPGIHSDYARLARLEKQAEELAFLVSFISKARTLLNPESWEGFVTIWETLKPERERILEVWFDEGEEAFEKAFARFPEVLDILRNPKQSIWGS